MFDLNGSLTTGPGSRRRLTTVLASGVATLGLAACHDSSTAPKTASSVTVVSGSGQTATVATSLASPVVLQVNDQNGSAMAGVVVTLSMGAGGGSVPSTQLTTDSNGQVSVSWTLGTVAGTDTLVATVGSLPGLDVVATATPGAPANLDLVSGDNQTAAAGTALPSALTVKVTDQYGNAVSNVAVTFSDDANGTFASTTVTTDTSGMASDTITLGPTAGIDDITASIQTSNGFLTVTLHETGS